MNIGNLIITNWDNLFEQAISDEGQFFNIIKKDDDMAYATGFSNLIKMHGDLDE